MKKSTNISVSSDTDVVDVLAKWFSSFNIPVFTTVGLIGVILSIALVSDRVDLVDENLIVVCFVFLMGLLLAKAVNKISMSVVLHSIPAILVLYVGLAIPPLKMEGAFLIPVIIHAMRRVRSKYNFYIIGAINVVVMGIVITMDHLYHSNTFELQAIHAISGFLIIVGFGASVYEVRNLVSDGTLSKWHSDNPRVDKLFPDIADAANGAITSQALLEGLFANSFNGVEIVHITDHGDDYLNGYSVSRNAKMEQLVGHVTKDVGIEYHLGLMGKNVNDKNIKAHSTEYFDMWKELLGKKHLEHQMEIATPLGLRTIESVNHLTEIEGEYYMIRIYNDITRETKQRKQLKHKKLKLEQYVESNVNLSRFAAVASHDLKSPLRTINSFAQLISHQHQSTLPQSVNEYLDIIIESSGSMQRFIEDLHEFSTVNTRKVNHTTLSTDRLVKGVLRSLSAEVKYNAAVITMGTLPECICGDEIKIGQLLSNLLRNAMKFQPKGARPEIHVDVVDDDTHWLFSVKDNGIGIKREHQKKIFKVFNRLHNQAEFDGSGLGLATCAKIVEVHKGRIWVESELGQGSTFFFTIQKELP